MKLTRRHKRLWKTAAGIAGAGLLSGLGTYAGLRLMSPAFRVGSKYLRQVGHMPAVAASMRRLGRHGSALEWGLATGALTSLGQAWDQSKSAANKEYRRWNRG